MKRRGVILLAGLVLAAALVAAGPRKFQGHAIAPATPTATPNPDCLPDSLCPDWVTRFDGDAHLYDRAVGIASSPDGTRVYVTGISSSTSNGLDFVTIAYDAATGQQIWLSRYDGPAHGADQPFYFGTGNQIALSADGSTLFVIGLSAKDTNNNPNDFVTIAYRASDGVQIWASRYSTPSDSIGTSLALSYDGSRVYVTGYSALGAAVPPAPPTDNYDFVTIAYDAADGDELWTARYEGPAAFWDVPYAIGVGNVQQTDGSRREQVFVTGRSNGASANNADADYATVAYDGLTGAELWVARYNGPGNDRDLAYGLSVSPDGSSVFITGESAGIGTASDYATISYDARTGAQRWIARYEQSDLDLGLGIAVSPTGNHVVVTGFSVNPGAVTVIDRSIATIAYDTVTGAEVWAARHGEVDGAAASHLSFSHDGHRIYVTGVENGNVVGLGAGAVGVQIGHAPALTVAYDAANGGEIWATHYLGPTGDEGGYSVTISPDDAHVFIAGGGQSNAADFATLSFTTGAPIPPPVELTKIGSRKIHGTIPYDIDLPQSGAPGIECRDGGANGNYTVVFQFANALTSVARAQVSSGSGTVSRSVIGEDRNEYVVDLNDVANAQTVTVTLSNVYDSAGNRSSTVSATMGVLVGDVNQDKFVLSGDYTAVRQKSGTPVDSNTFKFDVNADGFILSGDYTTTRQLSGTHLP